MRARAHAAELRALGRGLRKPARSGADCGNPRAPAQAAEKRARRTARNSRRASSPRAYSSNGRSNSVDSTIWVWVRVIPGWSRIRSSVSSK
jgi:hypothetical protein